MYGCCSQFYVKKIFKNVGPLKQARAPLIVQSRGPLKLARTLSLFNLGAL